MSSASLRDTHRAPDGPAAPVSLAEARLFLRVETPDDDGLIEGLLTKARALVEAEVGLCLTPTSPAPLRLAILMLVLKAYERGNDAMPLTAIEAWIAPYRVRSDVR